MDIDGLSGNQDRCDFTLGPAIIVGHGDEGLGRSLEYGHVAVVIEVDPRVTGGQATGGETVLSGGVHLHFVPAAGQWGDQVLGSTVGSNAQGERVIATAALGATGQRQLGRVIVLAIAQDVAVVTDLVIAPDGKAIGAGVEHPDREASGGHAGIHALDPA